MQRKQVLCLLMLILFLFSSTLTAEAFSYYNARAFALGGAYTGIVDDYSAIIYNPAGLAQTGWVGLGLGSTLGGETDNIGQLVSGVRSILGDPGKILEIDLEPASIEYGHLTGVRFRTLGAGISFQGRGSIDENQLDLTHYNTFNLGYAYRVLEPFGDVASLALGFNAKYLEGKHYRYYVEDFNDGESVVEEQTSLGNGFGVDFGIMIKLTDMVSVGAKIDNVIQPFSNDGNTDYIKGSERVYTVGAGINVPLIGLTATTDLSSIPHDGGTAFRAGIEKRFFVGLLALRAGLAQEGPDTRLLTGGLGLNVGPVKADLALGFKNGAWDEPSAVFGIRANF